MKRRKKKVRGQLFLERGAKRSMLITYRDGSPSGMVVKEHGHAPQLYVRDRQKWVKVTQIVRKLAAEIAETESDAF